MASFPHRSREAALIAVMAVQVLWVLFVMVDVINDLAARRACADRALPLASAQPPAASL